MEKTKPLPDGYRISECWYKIVQFLAAEKYGSPLEQIELYVTLKLIFEDESFTGEFYQQVFDKIQEAKDIVKESHG